MSLYQRTKRGIFEVIQPSAEASGRERIASRIFDCVILLLILLSVLSVFIATFSIPKWLFRILFRIEFVSILIFSCEYILRIWTANLLYPELGPVRSRIRYILSPMAIVDLVSILPIVLPFIHFYNLVGIRVFRLLRLLRIFKLNRYSAALATIAEVFRSRAQQMIASMFFVFIILILSSLFIYYAEHEAQPQKFKNAFSGLWWAVATLTTVGYGDLYPVTPLGRFLGAIIAILGIGMVAVPTSILSAGFMEMLEKQSSEKKAAAEKEKELPAEKDSSAPHSHAAASSSGKFEPPQYCPHCGKKLFP